MADPLKQVCESPFPLPYDDDCLLDIGQNSDQCPSLMIEDLWGNPDYPHLPDIADLSPMGDPADVDWCDLNVIYDSFGVPKEYDFRWETLRQSFVRTAENLYNHIWSAPDSWIRTPSYQLSPLAVLELRQITQDIAPLLDRKPLMLPDPDGRLVAKATLPIIENLTTAQVNQLLPTLLPFSQEFIFPESSIYRHTPQYQILMSSLPLFVQKARADIENRMRIRFRPADTPYKIVFVDRRFHQDAPDVPSNLEAITGTTYLGTMWAHYMIFYLDDLIYKIRVPRNGRIRENALETTLGEAGQKIAHEQVHLLIRQNFGDLQRVFPPWFKEGMAVFVSGQGANKMERTLEANIIPFHHHQKLSETTAQSLPERPLLTGPESVYARHYLMFDALLQRVAEHHSHWWSEVTKERALQIIVQQLHAAFLNQRDLIPKDIATIFWATLAKNTGLEGDLDVASQQFNREANIHADHVIQDYAKTHGFFYYLSVLKLMDAGRTIEARDLITEMQKKYPESVFAKRALWLETTLPNYVPDHRIRQCHNYLRLSLDGTLSDFKRDHSRILFSGVRLLFELGFNEQGIEQGENLTQILSLSFEERFRVYLQLALMAHRAGDVARLQDYDTKAEEMRMLHAQEQARKRLLPPGIVPAPPLENDPAYRWLKMTLENPGTQSPP